MFHVANEHLGGARASSGWAALDDPASAAAFARRAMDQPQLEGVRSPVAVRALALFVQVSAKDSPSSNEPDSRSTLVPPPQALGVLPALAERHPRLRMVLDHPRLAAPRLGCT